MIDPSGVAAALESSLLKEGEAVSEAEHVEGVINNFSLHKLRLEAVRDQVAGWLLDLPMEFHKGQGGGWSFLNACMTKDGEQWGEHRDIERLIALGLGLGIVRYCMPRVMWDALPGGMPYFIVDIPEEP